MKVRNWIKSVPAALLAAGIWVDPVYAIDIPLGDASFDQTPVDPIGYGYIASGHVTDWEDIDSIYPGSFGNWWYNSSYDSLRRPTPRTGTQALHGIGDYAWQTVPGGVTFETGKTYSFSAYLGGDTDSTGSSNGSDMSWLYIYDANNTPDLSTVYFDDDSLFGMGFDRDGGFINASYSGSGAGGAANDGWTIGGGNEWGLATISYTATVADNGKPIGVAYFGRSDAATDDVALCEGAGCFVAPPLPELRLNVDRDDGSLNLSNSTGGPVNISGYQLTSAFEGLDQANWVSIADNYDADSGGPVDNVNIWTELTQAGAHGDLSEADLASGTGGSLADATSINLGNAGAWIRNPNEDLVFEYISNGTVISAIINYTGTSLEQGDFDSDGDIDSDDWAILRNNQFSDLSSLTGVEAYFLGDMDGDKANTYPDFNAFKSVFETANGLGAFEAMLSAASVPEPSAVLLIMTGGLFVLPTVRRGARRN
jgi:hypothetical protein